MNGISSNGETIEISYPPQCSCGCYCCEEPCDFCEAVLARFAEVYRDVMSYEVKASMEEFEVFLKGYQRGEQ